MLVPALGVAQPFSACEDSCFERSFNTTFQVPLSHRVIRGKRAKNLKRTCLKKEKGRLVGDFQCVVKNAPRSKHRLLVILTKNQKRWCPTVTYSNLGFSNKNIAILNRKEEIPTALLIAAGAEGCRFFPPTAPGSCAIDGGFSLEQLILDDLQFHNEIVWESRCLRKECGIRFGSFNEQSPVVLPHDPS